MNELELVSLSIVDIEFALPSRGARNGIAPGALFTYGFRGDRLGCNCCCMGRGVVTTANLGADLPLSVKSSTCIPRFFTLGVLCPLGGAGSPFLSPPLPVRRAPRNGWFAQSDTLSSSCFSAASRFVAILRDRGWVHWYVVSINVLRLEALKRFNFKVEI